MDTEIAVNLEAGFNEFARFTTQSYLILVMRVGNMACAPFLTSWFR